MFDSDRISHWYIGSLLSWAAYALVVGIPVFHLWLGVSIARIVSFAAIACVLQWAITPLLFSARRTRQNPTGRFARGAIAMILLCCSIAIEFAYFVQLGQPQNPELRGILFGTPILAAIAGLIVVCIFSRCHKKSGSVS